MAGYYTLDIAELTKQKKGQNKQPFPHQQEAFTALSKTLITPIQGYKGTLLVLPTGGGKTFTSVNWICRNILSNGIKVLWLAQSSYLLDQAADVFHLGNSQRGRQGAHQSSRGFQQHKPRQFRHHQHHGRCSDLHGADGDQRLFLNPFGWHGERDGDAFPEIY